MQANAPRHLDIDAQAVIRRAREVLAIEAEAINGADRAIDDAFVRACAMIHGCSGRLVVSGIGKSGHVARKLAATFASTGTPALFVHPAEASHGDLGMITSDDVCLCLSYSGSTEELLSIVPQIKRLGAGLIAMTGNPASRLATLADVHIDASVTREACPLNLAPTASTTVALALGDALAMAVLDARGFDADDFARSHPGGALGRRLLTRVRDIMHAGDDVPCVTDTEPAVNAIVEMTRKRLGMTAVIDAAGRLVGIVTDGDLRRLLQRGDDARDRRVHDIMTRSPVTVLADALAAEALRIMEDRRIGQLLVADEAGGVLGALNFQDLLAAKIA
ncbi:MAG: KpsF/GutQ family sugar-phosphate isomerase [Burkholderiaceae bacterium]